MSVRNYLRNVYLTTMGTLSVPEVGIHILNGHSIRHPRDEYAFMQLLDELSKKVTFLNFNEAVQLITSCKKIDKPYVAFSFDDGFIECYNCFAKVMDQYNIKGAFFVNPNYVSGNDSYIDSFNKNNVHNYGKNPMRWEHLLELSEKGHVIGAHTMDHVMMNANDEEFLYYQIAKCKEVIKEQLHINCDYFAFPYGRLSDISMRAVEVALSNYKYVFSQSNYKYYFSFDGKVINRRHFEVYWPISHVQYFLSCKKR